MLKCLCSFKSFFSVQVCFLGTCYVCLEGFKSVSTICCCSVWTHMAKQYDISGGRGTVWLLQLTLLNLCLNRKCPFPSRCWLVTILCQSKNNQLNPNANPKKNPTPRLNSVCALKTMKKGISPSPPKVFWDLCLKKKRLSCKVSLSHVASVLKQAVNSTRLNVWGNKIN